VGVTWYDLRSDRPGDGRLLRAHCAGGRRGRV